MGKTVNNLNKSLEGSLELSEYSKTDHTHNYASSSHTHNYAGSSSAGGAATSANKVNTNLAIKLNGGTTEGTNLFTFNGSAAKTVNITPDSIGAATSSHGTHVNYSTTSPKVAGTAAVGSESTVARGDHVHAAQTSVSGNAGTATKLKTAVNITIGSKTNTFDGSGNLNYTLADIGAAAASHGTHLTLGTTSSTAFRGDYGNTAYTHSQAAHAPSNAQKNSDITKAEIETKLTGDITSHHHTVLTMKADNWKDAAALPSSYTRGETLFFSNNPTSNKFNNLTYGMVQTLKEYGSGSAAWQFLYPYNSDEGTFFVRQAMYGTDSWKGWAEVYTSLNKPTPADIGAAASSHGTHVTIGTGASNAAAGNHTHSNYALSSSVGTLSSLKTSAKGSLVAAINELFQNANNGKQLIASAIGSPLSSSDTFSAMSTKITTMSTSLKNFLVECGAEIESGKEGLNDLISLLISDSIMLKFPISFNLNSLPISCGQYHAAVLKKNGTIATVGYNYSGQLGTGNTNNAFVFTVPYNAGTNIIQVVCGGSHTVILKSDGSVKVTGENSSGQLGINTQDDMTSFTNMLNVNNDIIKVACGTNHTLVLKSDGTVWGTGNNSSGQLGIGTSTGVKVLTKSNLTDVVDIIANGNQSFAIDKAGDVWCTGLNGNGQLGMGNYTSYNSFVKVTSLSNVKQIACGGNHTMVLKNDGTVWATGYNNFGQLGLGTSGSSANTHSFTQVSINSVSHIACGSFHSALVKTDGTLWACGYNTQGQLGLRDTSIKTTFTQVTTNVSNAQYVFCGGNYTYYMRKDGSVWSCGGNDKGQLGIGNTTDGLTFVGLSSSLLG